MAGYPQMHVQEQNCSGVSVWTELQRALEPLAERKFGGTGAL